MTLHMAKTSIEVSALHFYAKIKTRGRLPDSKLKEFTTFMPCVLNGTMAMVTERQWKKNFLRNHKDRLALGRSVQLLCGTKVKARKSDGHLRRTRTSSRSFFTKFADTIRTVLKSEIVAECSYVYNIMHVCCGIRRNAWCMVLHR